MTLPKDWTANMLGWQLRMSRRGNVIAYAPIPSEKEPFLELPKSLVTFIKANGHKIIRSGVQKGYWMRRMKGTETHRHVCGTPNFQEVIK